MRFHAIDPTVLAGLRDLDDAGRKTEPYVDDEGGAPLRCCLRRSEPGEEIALVSYAPLRRWAAGQGVDPGAYDEQGPVFIHAGACAGPAGPDDGYPVAIHGEHRVLRAYGADGHILGGRLITVDSADAAAAVPVALAEVFTDPSVALVHIRAVEFGCFLLEISRG
jgi:hypothetical protein